MSLKGLELQIAIPKTFDAGKLADEKQQRIQVMQENANLQAEKQAERNKETVLETEKYKEINDDEQTEQEMNEQEKQEHEKQNKKNEASTHPYKGSFVDFSG